MSRPRLAAYLLILIWALELLVHYLFPQLNRHHRPVHYARIILEAIGASLYYMDWKKFRNKWSLAWAGLLCFFMGEESAWGQRYLHYSSPTWFIDNNVQQEVTIHNLNIGGYSTSDLWFYASFWVWLMVVFGVGFFIKNDAPVRKRFWNVRLPLPTRDIAVMACIMLELALLAPTSQYYIGPFLEATKLTAVCFGILTIYTAMLDCSSESNRS